MRVHLSFACSALIGFFAPACARSDPAGSPVAVRVANVVDRTQGSQPRLVESEVRALVAQELDRSPAFKTERDHALDVDVWVARLETEDGRGALGLHLRANAPERVRDALPDGLAATVELTHEDDVAVDGTEDLRVAARRAVAVFEAKLVLAEGQPGAVERLLTSSDPELVVLALETIRDRRLRVMADAVVPLLDHADDDVVRSAIECLGEIGSPQHVPQLIRASKLSDRSYANRLYEALASLGGQDAHGFLQFAVRNEDDPSLAAAAQRALQQVEAQGRGARSAPPTNLMIPRGHR